MKKVVMTTMLTAATLAVLFMSGCASVARRPSVGWVDNNVRPLKTGVAEQRSCYFFVLPSAIEGDLSITAAMKNGGITKVHHIDFEMESAFPYIYNRTIIYGE